MNDQVQDSDRYCYKLLYVASNAYIYDLLLDQLYYLLAFVFFYYYYFIFFCIFF